MSLLKNLIKKGIGNLQVHMIVKPTLEHVGTHHSHLLKANTLHQQRGKTITS